MNLKKLIDEVISLQNMNQLAGADAPNIDEYSVVVIDSNTPFEVHELNGDILVHDNTGTIVIGVK